MLFPTRSIEKLIIRPFGSLLQQQSLIFRRPTTMITGAVRRYSSVPEEMYDKLLNDYSQAVMKTGELQHEVKFLQRRLVNVYAVPYLRHNMALYTDDWNTCRRNSPNFDALDLSLTNIVNHNFDSQILENYKYYSSKWDQILFSSVNPGAMKFRGAVMNRFPAINLPTIAKYCGLGLTLLEDAKYGETTYDPYILMLLTTDAVVESLSRSNVLKYPVVLDVVKTFAQAINGELEGSRNSEDDIGDH